MDRGDAKDYLKTAVDYDIFILEPSKLIPSKRNIEATKILYHFLNLKSGSI